MKMRYKSFQFDKALAFSILKCNLYGHLFLLHYITNHTAPLRYFYYFFQSQPPIVAPTKAAKDTHLQSVTDTDSMRVSICCVSVLYAIFFSDETSKETSTILKILFKTLQKDFHSGDNRFLKSTTILI
jgi:hypothetical protein